MKRTRRDVTLCAAIGVTAAAATLALPGVTHALWRAELVERGFAIERPFLRMHRGRLETPGEPSQTYAITGPEFG